MCIREIAESKVHAVREGKSAAKVGEGNLNKEIICFRFALQKSLSIQSRDTIYPERKRFVQLISTLSNNRLALERKRFQHFIHHVEGSMLADRPRWIRSVKIKCSSCLSTIYRIGKKEEEEIGEEEKEEEKEEGKEEEEEEEKEREKENLSSCG
ncbi:hypothetical protein HZH68_014337 [Vespula germanica]|uniref:Uncharacterized protein n=1 Tax=Vespula germanica TaxID=30212 RepID=A0A834MUA2_VESGE|nr:hypothetical protein HZH68_014337 [Vespula germanica]